MKKFTWNNFDEEFINSIVYSENTSTELRPKHYTNDKDMLSIFMEKISPYPTRQFVTTYRKEIEINFLSKHSEIVETIYKFQGKKETKNYLTMIKEISNMLLTATLIKQYISALSQIGCGNEYYESSVFSMPITIDLTKSISIDIPLYDFQMKAVKDLEEYFIDEDTKNGLLVMPTGSGKTRTAVYFLLKNMVSNGYQVIWLTHRHMLIDQTADVFYNLAPIVKRNNANIKKFKIACISGEHSSIKATEKDDNVMILSIQSVCRSLDYLITVLGRKIIIVVDEAHHTPARSYVKTIEYIRKHRKNVKLLGLTATPIRGTDNDSKYLMKFYENKIIYSISMSELIKNQVLSTPIFEKVETNVEIEPLISIDEDKLIKKYGEIPATLADKIAHSSKRNSLIVDTYIKNKDKYGKTLIFALNIYHCFTLCEDFQKKDINCDYIYSGNNDNDTKIRKFKNNEIDVLVNINIMTEGTDVPDIETVFLTRPTQSEGLLMQMIGRGMRGKIAKGTEFVNIVDFCDKWEVFNKWLNPQWLIGEADEPIVNDIIRSKSSITIPFNLIRDIYKNIRYQGDAILSNTVALPSFWYALVDEEGNDYTMFVWNEQINGFKKLIKDKEILSKAPSNNIDSIMKKYFGGFVMQPKRRDIELFLYNLLDDDIEFHLFTLENRNKIDHTIVAKKFINENKGIGDIKDSVDEIYQDNAEIINNIYGDFIYYSTCIFDYIQTSYNLGSRSHVYEVPLELLPFRIEDTHNIEKLSKEVVDEMFNGFYEGITSIDWTDKPYSNYYGQYQPGGIIKINKLLDSPDVDREVIKFLIYHEMLHRDYCYHNRAFYLEEHKFPNYTEHNRFLDYKIYNYKLEF